MGKRKGGKKRKRDEFAVKNKTKEEIVSECERDKPKTLTSTNEQNAGSKVVFVSKLPYSVEPADLETIFKHCGEVVRIDLHIHPDGRFKGHGHVEFATTEAAQKARQLNNTELFKCRIKVHLTRGGQNTPDRSTTFQKGERVQPMKATEHSQDCEKKIKEKGTKSPHKSWDDNRAATSNGAEIAVDANEAISLKADEGC